MSETKRCPKCQAEIPAAAPEGLCPQCLLQVGLEPKTADAEPRTAAYSPSGSGFVPPTPEALQAAFPHLEILELLGKGGMGAVYKARQPGLDRLVAVKILPPEVSRDPAFAERFTREARALAMLNHPNIVGIYDSGRAGGYYYFVMEYVDGVNLRQAMRAGELKSAEALKIVPQICDALQFAHDEGIVHRDIKPENILLDKKGRVKIADFGLAKLLGKTAADVSLTGTQQVMGTMHYMAPEQLEGSRDVDHRADIYSLGVTFYEMLTGELPIGRFAAPSKKVQIDVRLDEVVLRSLEKEPEQRYQHASEIKTEVEAINLTPSSGRETPPSAGIKATNTAGLNPVNLLEATSGWKRWLPLVSLAAGVIGAFILMALSPNEGRDVCVGLSICIGFMLLSMIQSLLLTMRWTVAYRGHQIAVEFQNASTSRRLMIDGLTAASATGAAPASGGKIWDYELRATIPHGRGMGDEIVCTVERGMLLRCRIIALSKTPILPATDPKVPEQHRHPPSEIKTDFDAMRVERSQESTIAPQQDGDVVQSALRAKRIRQVAGRISAVSNTLGALLFGVMGVLWNFEILPWEWGLFGALGCFAVGIVAQVVAGITGVSKVSERLQPALAISSPEAKDRALLKVAQDAAEVGDSLTVVSALVVVRNLTLRDAALLEIVLRVAASGQYGDAVNLCKLMNDKAGRDDLLGKLAERRERPTGGRGATREPFHADTAGSSPTPITPRPSADPLSTQPAVLPEAGGGIPARIYWQTLGLATLTWPLGLILWNLREVGLAVFCVTMAAVIVCTARRAAPFLPATAERWRKRSHAVRFGLMAFTFLFALAGAYEVFLGSYQEWERTHWNALARSSDEFRQDNQGVEHRLLVRLPEFAKDVPRAELQQTDFRWSAGWLFTLTAPPNSGFFSPVGICGSFLLGLYMIWGTYYTLLTDASKWSVSWGQHGWPSVRLALTTFAPVLPLGLIAFFLSVTAEGHYSASGTTATTKSELADVAARLEAWAAERDFRGDDHSAWTLVSVPPGQQLAKIQVRHLWRPNVYDRWEMTWHGLRNRAPDLAVQLVSSVRTKQTEVSIFAKHSRPFDDLADINETIESLRRALDPDGVPAVPAAKVRPDAKRKAPSNPREVLASTK